MASAVSQLLEYLGGTKNAWHPTTTLFPEVDVAQLAKDLDLESQGRKVAAGERMVRDHAGFDIVERQVIDEIKRRGRISEGQYTSELEGYEGRMRAAAIGQDTFVMVKAAAEEGLMNFGAQVAEDRLPLDAGTALTQRVCNQFSRFIERHGLTDVAPYVPASRETTRALLWVAVVVLLETALNGMFFAAGSEAGLIGGALEAAMLSILNISVATVMGLLALRYLHHRSFVWKIVAALMVVVLAVAAFGLNVLIAHYREAFTLAAGAPVDFQNVLTKFQQAPFALVDAKSWMLGAFGLVLNGFATWKFYRMFDPYPGYGRVAVRKQQAIDNLVEVRRDCIEVLTEHRSIAVEEMRQVVQAVAARKHEYELAKRGRQRLHEAYAAHLQALNQAAESLGMAYHQAADLDAGHHLNAGLQAPPLDAPATEGDAEGHERAIETMSSYIEKIAKRYQAAVGSMPDVKLHVVEVGYAATA